MANGEFLICNDVTEKEIFQRLEGILSFLEQYSHFVNSFVIDFFVEDLWSKVPKQWQRVLENVDPLTLSTFLDSTKQFCTIKNVWPLSLLSFRAVIFSLTLSRAHIETMDVIYNYLEKNSEKNVIENEENTERSKILNRGVKLKKRHEISKLSRIVKIVSTATKCKRIVDVGSGQGHLSRNLAFEGNFHVTSFDAEDSHVSVAKKLDDKVKTTMQKQKSEFNLNLTHITKFIPSNVSEDDFTKLLRIDDEEFILLGLHTCGNLASTMLQVFSNCPFAVSLLSVSCCYMKLDSQSYPMSEKIKKLSNSHLSYHAREASCHAIEKHLIKLESGELSSLKIHCYRAVLESLIVKYHPTKKHLGLRSVKNAHDMTFAEYAKIALEKYDLHIPSEEFDSKFVMESMKRWKSVVVFYFIRLFLSTLVESAILIDKMIYLNEKGIQSCLIPLFEPKISPRNSLLLAIKK